MICWNILTVGKIKDPSLHNTFSSYLQRTRKPPAFHISVKASADSPDKEGKNIIKKIEKISPQGHSVLLTEWGDQFTSTQLAKQLAGINSQSSQINFIIAGAMGPSDELRKFCHSQLSLSPLTMPHQLAAVVLMEQLYRAQCILCSHPYHN